MRWLKKWYWLLVLIIAIALVIGWKEKRCQAQSYQCRADYAAQLSSKIPIDQRASAQQAIAAACEPNGYFCRLFGAANLPSMLLVIIGIGAIVAAVKTLRAIEEQTRETARAAKATEDSAKATHATAEGIIKIERAWIDVRLEKIGPAVYQVHIKNCGRTIAIIKEVFYERRFPPDSGLFDSATTMPRSKILMPSEIWAAVTINLAADLGVDIWKEVSTARIHFSYFGAVRYDDMADNPHQTEFVFYFRVPQEGIGELAQAEAPEYNKHT